MTRKGTQKARIIKITRETMDSSTIRFELEEAIEWRPGQFIMVSAEIDGNNVRRAYSISSSPTRDYLEITVRQTDNPTMSRYMNERKVGDHIDVRGPYGKFIWDEQESEKLVCLAAGCGITPFRGMLQYKIDKKLDNPFLLLYSCSYGDNVIYQELLPQLCEQTANANYQLSITRDPKGLDNTRRGRFDRDYLATQLKEYMDANFYICGTPGFVGSMIDLLESLGISRERIKREQWG